MLEGWTPSRPSTDTDDTAVVPPAMRRFSFCRTLYFFRPGLFFLKCFRKARSVSSLT
jgi:hypothetical protein